jgi:diadenosine tetraphosphate (Ap4A) HIT family hydrolase
MFNFFKSAPKNGAYSETLNGQSPAAAHPLPEIDERVFIETGNGQGAQASGHFTDQQPVTPPVPADHNIGVLYAFLDKNHEAKGYEDALLNPDSSHLNQNLEGLKNEFIRTVNKVKTFYEDFIQETEYHILSRGRSGMVDMVEELEMKKKIALGHVDKVLQIEESLSQEHGECKGILISYTRGFKNGLAAISHHHILTRRF